MKFYVHGNLPMLKLWGFRGGDRALCSILGFDTLYSGRCKQTFRSNTLLVSGYSTFLRNTDDHLTLPFKTLVPLPNYTLWKPRWLQYWYILQRTVRKHHAFWTSTL